MKKNILIIDDNKKTADALADCLVLTDRYEVEVLTYGSHVMGRLDKKKAPVPDLIILDIYIDETDKSNGEDIAAQIREHPDAKISAIPILIISGKINEEIRTSIEKPEKSIFCMVKTPGSSDPEATAPKLVLSRVEKILSR